MAWCRMSLKMINVTPRAHTGTRRSFLVLPRGLTEAMHLGGGCDDERGEVGDHCRADLIKLW